MKTRWLIGMLVGFLAVSVEVATQRYAQSAAIFACVNSSSGEVKIVTEGTACNGNRTLVQWDVVGPQGPTGPQGLRGDPGPQGPAGAGARTEAMTFNVNCDAGDIIGLPPTIGGATIDLIPGDTLLVSGTCHENVVINDEIHRITFDGQGTAMINGPDTAQPTVSVRGTGITIKGFTITGGRNGIAPAGGSRVTIQNCVIQGTGNTGISFLQGSAGTVDSSTIQNNANNGMLLAQGSSATVTNSTISGNAGLGINGTGGSATVTNSTISGNAGQGIHLGIGGSANLTGNNISNNQGNGIDLSTATAFLTGNTISNNHGPGGGVFLIMSTAWFSGGNTIMNNSVDGIGAQASGIRLGDTGASPNTISGNTRGISLDVGSMLTIRNATISGNTGNGLAVQSRSVASFVLPSTVNNNSGDGIRLNFGGAIIGLSQVSASGNGGFGLECIDGESSFQGSTAGITGNTAGNVTCTGF